MYLNSAIKIPDQKGKIIIKKKGSATYVLYEYGRDYRPDKKYAIPKRTVIGKVSATDETLMFPNEKYQEYFPDTVIPEELTETYRSGCLRIGSYLVIQKVLEEYHIPDMLFKYFGKDAGLILDFIAYMIVDEDNAGQYYPDFAYCHPLFSNEMQIYSDSKVSRLLSSITRDQILGFLDDWNEKRDHKQRIYISYDSTNKNCQAGDVGIVEFGKAKDNKGVPIFNLSIAFDKTNSMPLFYEEYLGSITDVSQFTFMVDKVEEYDYHDVGFILDRGYFSKENIQYMDTNGYSFVMMVKGCKSLVASLVMENLHTFESSRDCAIRSYRVYGKTVSCRLYDDDAKERYFHIYYNPSKQAAEREQLEQRIDKLRQFLEKHRGKDTKFGDTYKQYFKLTYGKDGRLASIVERTDVTQRALDLCGYFCIITSEEMTASQALILYKGRDLSEKLFQADKSFLGSRSMRTQTDESVSAKIFIEFLALIVRNRIYTLLKEIMLRLEIRRNYMTVPAALRELEKIEMVRRNKGQYRLDHAVTKKQREILSAFGISEENVESSAVQISKLLANSKSLIDKEEEEPDGTDTLDWII